MNCALDDDGPEQFRRGDEIVLPFLIKAGESIVNISDGTVTGEVRVHGKTAVIPLAVGAGIVIENAAPLPAVGDAAQEPHGTVTLAETFTAQLPTGLRTRIILYFTNSTDVRMSTEAIQLEGLS